MFSVWSPDWINMQIGVAETTVIHILNWDRPTKMWVKRDCCESWHTSYRPWMHLFLSLHKYKLDRIRHQVHVHQTISISHRESLTTEFLMAAFSVKPCAFTSVFLLNILTRHDATWRTLRAEFTNKAARNERETTSAESLDIRVFFFPSR